MSRPERRRRAQMSVFEAEDEVRIFAFHASQRGYEASHQIPCAVIVIRCKSPAVVGQHPCRQWQPLAASLAQSSMPLYVCDAATLAPHMAEESNPRTAGTIVTRVAKWIGRLNVASCVLVGAGIAATIAVKIATTTSQQMIRRVAGIIVIAPPQEILPVMEGMSARKMTLNFPIGLVGPSAVDAVVSAVKELSPTNVVVCASVSLKLFGDISNISLTMLPQSPRSGTVGELQCYQLRLHQNRFTKQAEWASEVSDTDAIYPPLLSDEGEAEQGNDRSPFPGDIETALTGPMRLRGLLMNRTSIATAHGTINFDAMPEALRTVPNGTIVELVVRCTRDDSGRAWLASESLDAVQIQRPPSKAVRDLYVSSDMVPSICYSDVERWYGAIVVRGDRCLLVRIDESWTFPATAHDDEEATPMECAVDAVSDICGVSEDAIVPFAHIPPIAYYPTPSRAVFLYVAAAVARRESTIDEESDDEESNYEWFAKDAALSLLSPLEAQTLRRAAESMEIAVGGHCQGADLLMSFCATDVSQTWHVTHYPLSNSREGYKSTMLFEDVHALARSGRVEINGTDLESFQNLILSAPPPPPTIHWTTHLSDDFDETLRVGTYGELSDCVDSMEYADVVQMPSPWGTSFVGAINRDARIVVRGTQRRKWQESCDEDVVCIPWEASMPLNPEKFEGVLKEFAAVRVGRLRWVSGDAWLSTRYACRVKLSMLGDRWWVENGSPWWCCVERSELPPEVDVSRWHPRHGDRAQKLVWVWILNKSADPGFTSWVIAALQRALCSVSETNTWHRHHDLFE